MTGGGGRGGLGRLTGIGGAALPFRCFPFCRVLEDRIGLCVGATDARVETECAGDERWVGVGEEDRRSRCTDETKDESRSFDGTFVWELGRGSVALWLGEAGESGSALTRDTGEPADFAFFDFLAGETEGEAGLFRFPLGSAPSARFALDLLLPLPVLVFLLSSDT